MKRITIIGGGASGTLLAAHLLRFAGDDAIEINMVEKRSVIGRGVAYSTQDDVHLLNVPASRMGAFTDDVGHFLDWLRDQGYSYGPDSFVPRRCFGEYLLHVLQTALENKPDSVKFNVFEDDAVDLELDARKTQVTLRSGEFIYSEKVVLAFGNFLPPHPSVKDRSFTSHPKYFRSPWQENVFSSIGPNDRVLIIGTGLSMVDVVLKLAADGHKGAIKTMSTRGLLPAVHKLGATYPSFADELRPLTRITDILKVVRDHIRKAEADGIGWRAVIDSLRSCTQDVWRNLPVREKRDFMQHLSRYWNVARHRMPAVAASAIDELCAAGRFEVLKGRLLNIDAGEEFNVRYRSNGTETGLDADAIFNCIGSESNFQRLDSSLIKSLFERGHVRGDALHFGLDALPNGAILGQNGEVSNVIFTLGTALKGTLWETTAIPEIRAQAGSLAKLLLSD